MEQLDVFSESGMLTGRTVARGTRLPAGEYYRVVHVWIRNEVGRYLIQQRALHLASDPGVWATTVGYVLAGEDSISGAIREVREELGLQLSPESLRLFNRLKTEHRIEDVWIADVSSHLLSSPAPGPDVAAWKWASRPDVDRMIGQGAFFPYSYFSNLPE